MPTFECRTCGRHVNHDTPEAAPHRPFCSNRCQMADLADWFDESYRFSTPLTSDPDNESGLDASDDTPNGRN